MTISEYVKNINKHYKTGISREFGFQGSELGTVQINNEQYFGNVPLKAWNFYIGGYQPAEKWLKDRRSRTLSMEADSALPEDCCGVDGEGSDYGGD